MEETIIMTVIKLMEAVSNHKMVEQHIVQEQINPELRKLKDKALLTILSQILKNKSK